MGTGNCYWRTSAVLCSKSGWLFQQNVLGIFIFVLALAKKKESPLDELNLLQNSSLFIQYSLKLYFKKDSIISKIKLIIYKNLQKYAFLTIVLCASIPNPLFDLAGLTCGHFLIPFSLFFGATALGKSIIKVHLQMIFVIFIFKQSYVEIALQFIEKQIPSFKNFFSKLLEEQKLLLHSPDLYVQKKSSKISQIWEGVILIMILYFIYSMINSLVNDYLNKQQAKTIQSEQNGHHHHTPKRRKSKTREN